MWYRCQDSGDGSHVYVNAQGQILGIGGTTGSYLVVCCGQQLSGSTYASIAAVNDAIDTVASFGGVFDLASI